MKDAKKKIWGIFTFRGAFLFFICGPIVLKIGQCT